MKKDSEKKPGKPAFDPKDLVDKHIALVYGPLEWYDSRGNLDDNHPSARRFKERIRQIEERNRQRRIQREMEAQDCDEPIANVYGPMPPENDTRKVNIDELVDMPTCVLYGPMPPMPPEEHTIPEHTISEEEEKDEDKKGEKEDTGGIRGFFAGIFGNKHS